MTEKTQEKEKKGKTSLRERIKKSVHGAKKAVVVAKVGLATMVGGAAVGGGCYIHNQFHKSPEQIREETTKMEEAVDQEAQKVLGTNTVGKAAGKIAKTGASHGGAARAWIAEKLQKEP